VAKKRKKKKFTTTKAVKSMARTAIGQPPSTQREESRKRLQKLKHKPTLGKLLADSDTS
jgi:hypothetical protein